VRFVVCYDISNPKVWRKVYKILKSYGIRTQFSVFETTLPENSVRQIIQETEKFLEKGDKVFAFCVKDYREIIRIGGEDLLKNNVF